jgi:hypothetical protein
MSSAESFEAVVDANSYLTVATADADGRPWATPVWFAHEGYREYFWISKPQARHSQNIAARSDVGIVIFDSQVAPGTGGGVYLEATAAELNGDELDRGIAIYNRAEEAAGIGPLTLDKVTDGGPFRMYGAVATARYLLDDHDERVTL